MKKYLIILLIVFLAPMDMIAQSYESLWGKVEAARRDDLPQTQLEALDLIVDKAMKEKEYGHLIKAQLNKVEAITSVTPDSLKSEVDRLVKWEQAVRGKDETLAAVLQSVLGTVYKNCTIDDNRLQISEDYYKLSLSNKSLLADTKSGNFVPALIEGVDSKYFNYDLLHVLAMQAGEYEALLDFYVADGNREAACLVAANILSNMPKKLVDNKEATSIRLHKADSLLQQYGDLEVAGELAIIKYQFLEETEDVKAGQLMAYIKEAQEKWGQWPRMTALDNQKSNLTLPCFFVDAGCQMILPETKRMVEVIGIRNIPSLTMRWARTDIDVSKGEFHLFNEHDLAKVREAIVKGSEKEITHQYSGHQPYDKFKDSLELPPLKKGVYLLEFEAGDKSVKVERTLMYVSDIFLISEPQPDNSVRLIVVSASTGKPLPKAKIRVSSKVSTSVLTCDNKGEAIYTKNENDYRQPEFFVYTDDDRFCPSQQLWFGRYSYDKYSDVRKNTALFTDRSIYRPGQEVHVGIIRYECLKGLETKALEGENLEVVLRDANYKEVAKKKVVTDKFGKADVDFLLPESGLTGRFTITTNGGSASFRVEEYKRPTFQVEIPDVEEPYKSGDTITVKGYAKTYAGVPVQGATVEYTVKRETSWWWYRGNEGSVELVNDSTVTDEEGAFYMRVPMVMSDIDDTDQFGWSRARFYDIAVHAMVTDQGFETHEADLTLPLSNKATALSVSLADRMRKDEMKTVNFYLRNSSGKEIDGIVNYSIDGRNERPVEANKEVSLPALASGKHVLEAICMGDTVKKEFVVFSLDDKKPCVETHDWFYASDSQFKNDGTPVYVQVGSSDRDTRVYYSVFSEKKVLEQGSFTLDNANQTRSWVYEEKYGSGLFITFAWVRDGKLYSHSQSIRRPMPDKRIMLSWHTFRDKLTPGAQETWVLKALYPDGTPADAQLMATLYDQSLNQIESHSWYFNDLTGAFTPYTSWRTLSFNDVSLHGSKAIREKTVPSLNFTTFDQALFEVWEPRLFMYDDMSMLGGGAVRMEMRVKSVEMESVSAENKVFDVAPSSAEMEVASSMRVAGSGLPDNGEEKQADAVQVRENLDETAFFMPKVASDEDGNMVLKFQLPESVTTWQFIGLATDTRLNHGTITSEAVTKKDVMVQPNIPRFVRLGDKAQITTRIFNTTENPISGEAVMELVDPETEAVVFTQVKDFNLEANQTSNATFDYEVEGEPRLLVCRIMAKGDGFSDGEQHYLPVLPSMELVTRTLPFTQNGPQTFAVNLDKLFPKGVDNAKLTVEYTNNPAWMMIQALPTMAAGDSENAITQATSYYANTLGQFIMNMSPAIKQTVMKWREELVSGGSMVSNLDKNEELKDLLLNETPWVGQADKEESQKRSLVKFFDEQTISFRLSQALEKLQELQNADGSWSWWKGMDGSPYMTTAVSEMFIRINTMVGKRNDNQRMLDKAFTFMDKALKDEEEHLRKLQEKGVVVRPSETALNILYNYALDGREPSDKTKATIQYLIDLLDDKAREFTIYGKARSAVVLAYFGKERNAALHMKSLSQYSVATEDMGRYYDTRKAYYSWCSYNIPTEVAAIEAYQRLEPSNRKVIEEMRLWLLQQKRAQMWSTPINSVDAIYAFLNGNVDALNNKVETVLALDGRQLETSDATAGLGYVKTAVNPKGNEVFTAEKQSSGTSWGALYAQFTQEAKEVDDTKAGLSVKREIIAKNGGLKVGDKVVVRVTIKAERDLDFVEVVDRRPACMEPVEQRSGYRRGCYISPKDYTTNYYFDKMGKGTHVIETEYYIDRLGCYESGTCKAQCAYAPEFSATTKAYKIEVNK